MNNEFSNDLKNELKNDKNLKFLVVEDSKLINLGLTAKLEKSGSVVSCFSREDALSVLSSRNRLFDIAFIDLDLEYELAGLDVLKSVIQKNIYAVILTGREENTIVESAYKIGCHDYLNKPFNQEDLGLIFNRFKFHNNKNEVMKFLSASFQTSSDAYAKQLEAINQFITSDRPLYISGETGVGKTFLAKSIHQFLFSDKEVPFIHLNCAEVPPNLIESEIFGHKKGAFSGADKDKQGLMKLANNGILFLDEISTMPMETQQKFLKSIEEKCFYPLGSEKLERSNFKLISATCENLEEIVQIGKFRKDLYYRIMGIVVKVPPLRERKNDIPLLINKLIKNSKRKVFIPQDVLNALESYWWPGNIRELNNLITIFMTKENGLISMNDVPDHVLENSDSKHFNATKITTVAIDNSCKNDNREVDAVNTNATLLTDRQIEYVSNNGLIKFIEKLEQEIVDIFFQKNNFKVRKTVEQLKISNSVFYKARNCKEK